MTAADLLERLTGVVKSGGGWKARCPAHDDHNPSLSVREADDGRVLLKCHADCKTEDVVSAMGLTMADLSPASTHAPARSETVYTYVNENGRPLFETVRFTHPKDFRQRLPDGRWGLNGARRVLYRLPEVLAAAASGARVYVVEGEKDADRLASLGLVATTNPMGAGKWQPAYSEALRGAEVMVLPDQDDAGQKHAGQVARMTSGARIVALPGLSPKGDVSDWLDAGHTVAQLVNLCDTAVAPGGCHETLTLVTRAMAAGIGCDNERPILALPTHLPTWNDACRGRGGREGLARMWHTIVAGAANKGKTLFALNVADAALVAGLSVLYVLLEGAKEDVMSRLYALASGTPINYLQPGKAYSRKAWQSATEAFHARNAGAGSALYFAERTGRQLPAILAALHTGAATGCALIVVDYLQLIRVPDAPSVYEATVRLSGELCEAAIRENVTTLGLSQYNRGALNDKERGMTIHSLSGGGALENDADQVLLLDYSKAKHDGYITHAQVNVAKNRHGPTRDFAVVWDYATLRVREPQVRTDGRYDV